MIGLSVRESSLDTIAKHCRVTSRPTTHCITYTHVATVLQCYSSDGVATFQATLWQPQERSRAVAPQELTMVRLLTYKTNAFKSSSGTFVHITWGFTVM